MLSRNNPAESPDGYLRSEALLKPLKSLSAPDIPLTCAQFSSLSLSSDHKRATIAGEAHDDRWELSLADSGVVHLTWHNGPDAYDWLTRELYSWPETLTRMTMESNAAGWRLSGGAMTVDVLKEGIIRVQTLTTVFSYSHFYRHNHHLRCALQSSAQEHLYGLGEKVGGLDKKGRFWTQWATDAVPHEDHTDPLYQAIPFALLGQSAGFRGVFLANSGRTYFDATVLDTLWIGVDDGPLSLYSIPGPTPQNVVGLYTAITGRFPLPPQYALGFQQSRYSYMNQSEVLKLAQTFREYSLPLDVIYLDIDYMDGYRVFTFNPQTFPDPKELTSALSQLGVSVVSIIDPGVKADASYSVYTEGRQGRHFMEYLNGEEFHSQVWPGLCAFPDFAQDETRKWWGSLHHALVTAGIRGIWNDMKEPAWWGDGSAGTSCHPDEEGGIIHHARGQELPHRLVHNMYALLEAHATYDALASSGARPFILSRSGFSGIQRYAAVWTGDNSSRWDHLAMAIPMCLNLGLSGIPMVGPDIAGFLDNASPELYARWIQAGVFFPFVRAHSAIGTDRHEPWSFGDEVLDIARRYIQYRYRLLPYWYALLYQAHLFGTPMMRPMFWDDPSPEFMTVDDQFFVGDAMLVAPVVEEGAVSRPVSLPSGRWYDPWRGQWLEGPLRMTVEAPLDQLPLFLRAGAILPLADLVQSTAEWGHTSPWPATIWVLPGDGALDLYADDGYTNQYSTGHYLIIRFTVRESAGTLRIGWSRQQGGDFLVPPGPVVLKAGPLPPGVLPRIKGDGRVLQKGEKSRFAYVSVDLSQQTGTVDVVLQP